MTHYITPCNQKTNFLTTSMSKMKFVPV